MRAASVPSSSDADCLSAEDEPGTGDDVVAAIGAATLLRGEASDATETTDAEEAWVNPMYWDFGLARHVSWFTVHAVEGDRRLLCGRVMDHNFESVVNPPSAYPVCRVCRARVRGRVEAAQQSPPAGRGMSPDSPNADDGDSVDGCGETPPYTPESASEYAEDEY